MNRPFPNSLVPLFQNESKCETIHMKMSCACSFIFTQIKVIFIRIVLHLDLFPKQRHKELRNGLFMMSKIAGIRRRNFLQNEAYQNLESQIRLVLSHNDHSICHNDLKVS